MLMIADTQAIQVHGDKKKLRRNRADTDIVNLPFRLPGSTSTSSSIQRKYDRPREELLPRDEI